MEKINNKEKYDAVWISNSIWLYMIDNGIKITNSKIHKYKSSNIWNNKIKSRGTGVDR